MRAKVPEPTEVVLGAKVYPDGTPSQALVARTERAVDLYRDQGAAIILLTGGPRGARPTEAQVMRDLLVARGVPEKVLLLEEQSRTTAENAAFCAPLLRARGVEEVHLVTDPFHMFRAARHFYAQGFRVVPVPASLDGRGLTFGVRAKWRVRELAGLLIRPSLLLQRPPR